MRIFQTSDYSQFKFFHTKNRTPFPKKLIESISQKNMLAEHPIICTPNLYVIDGQNRLKAAEFLKVPVFYLISEEVTENDIALCQTQTPWKLEDFLKFFRSYNTDYEFTYQMSERYKIPLHVIVRLCGNMSGNELRKFKEGKFVIKRNKRELETYIEQIKEIFDLFQKINDSCGKKYKNISQKIYYVLFSIVKINGYDHRVMMEQCKKYRDKVLDAIGFMLPKNIKRTLILEVYNFKKSAKKLPFENDDEMDID